MNENTLSLCPVCLRRLPARRVTEDGNVYLIKNCPEHGAFRTVLWRGYPGMEEWCRPEQNTPPLAPQTASRLGCPHDCGLCSSHEQVACCVLLEITKRCSLRCPLCFADAGEGGGAGDWSLEEYHNVLAFLQGQSPDEPYNLQLSGGEPAEHPDIVSFVKLAREMGFSHVQLNSNGLRLAEEAGFAEELAKAGLSCVFLQFDGTNEEAYTVLRGRPLLEAKRAAIRNCEKAGLAVVLTVALVPGVNTDEVGNILSFAFRSMPTVRGIHFLPVGHMGRGLDNGEDEARFTLPELIRALSIQSGFRLSPTDFLPIVSGSCLCAFYGNFLVETDGGVTPITEPSGACCPCKKDAIASARAYLAKRWGGAYQGKNDEWDLFLRGREEKGFSISAMAFMDAWSFDVERVKKCRFQVATRDARLIPFCAYHVTSVTGERLYGD